jgi:hypothetical protein
MAEEAWAAARLIPVSGISGPDEQERRGTSAFLAVLGSVKEFGRSITTRIGAPAGTIETFIEVPFQLNGRRCIPDGLIRVTRGPRTWTALVEVKTGKNDLRTDQLENYLDVAREHGFQSVLTISNQISTTPGVHPTPVDKRKCRNVSLHHLSWSQVHTEAIMERINKSISDPDQAWILNELNRYLQHPRSGAIDFDDMGPSWVTLRDAVRTETLRASDDAASDVASKWEQLIGYAGMRFGRRLGIEAMPALTRRERDDPALRTQAGVASLVASGRLSGALRIPNTVSPIELTADIRASRVSCAIEVSAPQAGKPLTRVNWLLRQLKESPPELRIDAVTPWARTASRSELLRKVREDPGLLVDEQKREIRSFRLVLAGPVSTKRGPGKASFAESTLKLLDKFYADVVQHIKPWSAPAPKVQAGVSDDDAEPTVKEASTLRPLPPEAVLQAERSESNNAESGSPGAVDLAPSLSHGPDDRVSPLDRNHD